MAIAYATSPDPAQAAVRPRGSRLQILAFRCGGTRYGISTSDVQEITPFAELLPSPLPRSIMEGLLNLSGELIPVIQLGRVLGRSEVGPDLFASLVILRQEQGRFAVRVDAVERVVNANAEQLIPLEEHHAFHDCANAVLSLDEGSMLILAVDRLLLTLEGEAFTEVARREQARLVSLEEA